MNSCADWNQPAWDYVGKLRIMPQVLAFLWVGSALPAVALCSSLGREQERACCAELNSHHSHDFTFKTLLIAWIRKSSVYSRMIYVVYIPSRVFGRATRISWCGPSVHLTECDFNWCSWDQAEPLLSSVFDMLTHVCFFSFLVKVKCWCNILLDVPSHGKQQYRSQCRNHRH